MTTHICQPRKFTQVLVSGFLLGDAGMQHSHDRPQLLTPQHHRGQADGSKLQAFIHHKPQCLHKLSAQHRPQVRKDTRIRQDVPKSPKLSPRSRLGPVLKTSATVPHRPLLKNTEGIRTGEKRNSKKQELTIL